MLRKFLTHGLLAFMLAFVSNAFAADDPETPKSLAGGKIVSAAEAKAMVGKSTMFDMRKAVSYGKGHLPGAQPLPYDQKSDKSEKFDATMDKFDMTQLPADKSAAVMFYSDGPVGWKSYKAAVIAIRNGYTNVSWFRGGTAEWEATGFPYEQ